MNNKLFNEMWLAQHPQPKKSKDNICKKCKQFADSEYDDGPGHYGCTPCNHEWKTNEWYYYNEEDLPSKEIK